MSLKPIGIYIHIPFCRSKCLYCAFNSVTGEDFSAEKWSGLLMAELLWVLRREGIDGATQRLGSIYFGGGTPSLMPPRYIASLISGIKEIFGMGDGVLEVTLEANPEGLGPALLEGFLSAGVNRLSLGVQSLDDGELKTLGRGHGAADAAGAIGYAEEAGFTNISLDLIYGLPGQTVEGWLKTLDEIIGLRAAHISLYNLSIEEFTPFYSLYPPRENGRGQEKPFVDEETERLMYERAIKVLKGRGYNHYEISNLALPGRESRHNRGYWLGRDYIGCGPGAHSFLSKGGRGRRFWNEKDLSLYEKKVSLGEDPAAGSEMLSRDEAMTEAVMLGLRMLDQGIDAAMFRQAFGVKAWERFLSKCLEYERRGLLNVLPERVVLCSGALFTANEVCLGLVS